VVGGGGGEVAAPGFETTYAKTTVHCSPGSSMALGLYGLRPLWGGGGVGGIANINDNKQAKFRFLYLFWFICTRMCSSFQSYSFISSYTYLCTV
jgi:hypothetical protein